MTEKEQYIRYLQSVIEGNKSQLSALSPDDSQLIIDWVMRGVIGDLFTAIENTIAFLEGEETE